MSFGFGNPWALLLLPLIPLVLFVISRSRTRGLRHARADTAAAGGAARSV